MPLLVPHAAHRLHQGLVGVPLVPVPVLALLKDVLAAPVPRVLVAHPPVHGSSAQWGRGDKVPSPGQESRPVPPLLPPLRSVQGPDAGHAVLEAVGPQAGHVVIHNLHLAPGVAGVLKEVDLVVGAVLRGTWVRDSPITPSSPPCPPPPLLTIWRGRRDMRLSLLWLLDQESQRG